MSKRLLLGSAVVLVIALAVGILSQNSRIAMPKEGKQALEQFLDDIFHRNRQAYIYNVVSFEKAVNMKNEGWCIVVDVTASTERFRWPIGLWEENSKWLAAFPETKSNWESNGCNNWPDWHN